MNKRTPRAGAAFAPEQTGLQYGICDCCKKIMCAAPSGLIYGCFHGRIADRAQD